MPITGSAVWMPPSKQATVSEMDLLMMNMKATAGQPKVRQLPDTFIYASPPANYIPPPGTEAQFAEYRQAAAASTATTPLIANPWDVGGAKVVTVQEAQEAQAREQAEALPILGQVGINVSVGIERSITEKLESPYPETLTAEEENYLVDLILRILTGGG